MQGLRLLTRGREMRNGNDIRATRGDVLVALAISFVEGVYQTVESWSCLLQAERLDAIESTPDKSVLGNYRV
jgi:hypothetical protein